MQVGEKLSSQPVDLAQRLADVAIVGRVRIVDASHSTERLLQMLEAIDITARNTCAITPQPVCPVIITELAQALLRRFQRGEQSHEPLLNNQILVLRHRYIVLMQADLTAGRMRPDLPLTARREGRFVAER